MIYANTHVTSRHDLAGLVSRRIANSQLTTIIKSSFSVCHRLAVQVQHDVLLCRDHGLAGDISQQLNSPARPSCIYGRGQRVIFLIADLGSIFHRRRFAALARRHFLSFRHCCRNQCEHHRQ